MVKKLASADEFCLKGGRIFRGEMAEWSIAAVLKTVEPQGSGGSNPSLSEEVMKNAKSSDFAFFGVCGWKFRTVNSCPTGGFTLVLLFDSYQVG